MLIAESTFWLCIGLIFWTYIGYPVLLYLISGFVSQRNVQPEGLPSLTMIIAAYNEAQVIDAKLKNTLELDYPREQLQVIVLSDGSDDGTDERVKGWQHEGIELLRIEGRKGKTSCQNQAVMQAKGEILIFSDANAMYDRDALKLLANAFTDPEVGCAEGRRLDYSPGKSAVASNELSYRDYESWIKILESKVASCTGATGPIYAVRRSAYVDLPEEMISDLMEPIMIRFTHGLRQIYVPQAVSREEVLVKMSSEYKRKVRIITRCLNSILRVEGLTNPLQAGSYALQIWSHRLLRWLVPVLSVPMILAAIVLHQQPVQAAFLALTGLFFLVTIAGWILEKLDLGGPSIFRLPYYFTSANLAALMAWFNWARGRNILTWNPDRGE